MNLFKNKCILDFGSGSSPYYPLIAKRISHYYAVDFYKEINKSDKYEQIQLSETGEIPLNEIQHPIDILLSNQVLQELNEPGKYLDQIAEIMQSGAILFMTFPFVLPAGKNDKIRLTPYYIFHELLNRDFEILSYSAAGYFFTATFLSLNMLIVLKNEYNPLTSNVRISKIKSIIFSPVIAIHNLLGIIMDRFIPFYKFPANILVIARKK